MTTRVWKCKKCDFSEFRDSEGPHYCRALTTHKDLFGAGKHVETCAGEMEVICPSTDTDVPSADEKKNT